VTDYSMNKSNDQSVFLLPYRSGHLVFAPLAGRVVYANSTCAAQLQNYIESGNPEVVSPLITQELGGLEWLTNHAPPAPLPVDRQFHPAHVTLFLTNRCNLRCTYCYAQAGDFDCSVMPREVYEAAIDLIVRNAQRAGYPPQIDFHGGGEPTVAWEALTGAITYAKERSPSSLFGLATNGVMSQQKGDFVAETFRMVTLSFDGPEDIQDSQRPCVSGSGSFSKVMAFIDTLRRRGTHFAIRATVTNLNAGRLPELVDFFVKHTGCKLLHFEPASCIGRCKEMPSGVPNPMEFAQEFLKAMEKGKEHGVQVRFSGARPIGVFSSFCGCAQDGFNVTPKGDVTACFEVCGDENPLKETFFYGRFDPVASQFKIDMAKLADLRNMTVHNKPKCARCFAKWSCAGDCLIKGDKTHLSQDGEDLRCRMIQEITKAMLVEFTEAGV